MFGACTKSASAAAWRGAAILGVTCALAVVTTAEPQQPPAGVDEQVGPVIVARAANSSSALPGLSRKMSNAFAELGQPPMVFGNTDQAGGIAGTLVNCAQPAANCQLPDQAGHGEGGIIGATSDQDAGFSVADNFSLDAGGTITTLCWWGFYRDFNAGLDCGDTQTDDHFTITFHFNVPGCPSGTPGVVISTFVQDNGDLVGFQRVATGNDVGNQAEYEYTCTIAGPVLSAGRCTWIEIENNTAVTTPAECFWLWSTAPSADEGGNGDAWSYQFNTDPPENDFDLAFCINEPLGDTVTCTAGNPPNVACVGAEGECYEANGTPSCNEECCCTLVCETLPLCCITEWTEACASAALDLGCTALPPIPLCDDAEGPGQDPANCQVYTDVNAYNSTTSPGVEEDLFTAADDFTTVNNETITDICWQGTYGVAAVADNFRIRIMGDAGGFPDITNVLSDDSQGAFLSFSREDTNVPGSGGWIIYQYRATIDVGAAVTGGECYWLEITNGLNPGESWFWETAGDGNGRCMIDGNGDDTIPNDGYDAFDVVGGVDLGFCLGVPLDPPACGFELLYETGNHEVVLFDDANGGTYDATNLGWSSGDLADGDHQRRTAQAFDLPPLPGGANAWSVEQITLEGFDPGGVTNEFMNFEIFARTSLDQDIQEADSLFQLTEIAISGDPTDPDYPNEFGILVTGLFMEPGDYWLTFWASNTSALPGEPQPIPSNIAWFTNAPDGINNKCTVNMPPPAVGYEGCVPSDPDGYPVDTPAMLRAKVWPPAALPSDGFGAYSLPITTLTVDPDNDPTPDPNDLYNAAMRMRGTAVLVAPPCPWDCQTEPNGVVDIPDFLALLAQWAQVDTSCDFDGGGVSVTDFLAYLGNFGPCPAP